MSESIVSLAAKASLISQRNEIARLEEELANARSARESIEEFSHAKSDMIDKQQAVVDAAREVCAQMPRGTCPGFVDALARLKSEVRALGGELNSADNSGDLVKSEFTPVSPARADIPCPTKGEK